MHILVGLAALVAFSTDGTQTQSIAPPPSITPMSPAVSQPAQNGKIVMYRGGSIMGFGIACPIRYKGQEVVELARGKYAVWPVPPGRYILTNHTSSVEVAVDPGETRYVRCQIKSGMLVARADLQIVDEESFNEHGKEFELKPLLATALIPK